jgi:hypothetical protein
LESDLKTPLEKTLLQHEDKESFGGWNRLLTSSNGWLSNTDLSVEVDMLAPLEDKKTGKKYTLDTTWHKTVRFDGQSPRVNASECDNYDKHEVN